MPEPIRFIKCPITELMHKEYLVLIPDIPLEPEVFKPYLPSKSLLIKLLDSNVEKYLKTKEIKYAHRAVFYAKRLGYSKKSSSATSSTTTVH